MGKKGFVCFYKHTQLNWIYSSPKAIFVASPRSSLSPQRDSTNDCSTTIFAHNQLSPVSNPTTTNQVDTDFKNYYDTQYFATLRKYNHVTPEIPDTTTTMTPFQPTVHSRLRQTSASNPTTSLKLPLSVK